MAELKNRVKEYLEDKYGEGNVPSQEKLAVLVGLSQTTVSRWLGNKIDRFDGDALSKWAEFLECRSGDLIYTEGEERWLKKK